MWKWTFILFFSLPAFLGAQDQGEYDLWREGRSFWYQKEWQNAADAYKALIERYPESPRACKSANWLGYCYVKMNRKAEAFKIFSNLVLDPSGCKDETLLDAKSKRLQLAFELFEQDPSKKLILLEGLADPNEDIRLLAATYLSDLNDPSGLEVFFSVLKNEDDQDRRDTAAKHILKLGSAHDKQRLQKILETVRERNRDRTPKFVRLIIRDVNSKEEVTKINLPIKLFNIALQAIPEEDIPVIEKEAGIDLNNLKIDLEALPSGHVLFKVVNAEGQEIKLFLE